MGCVALVRWVLVLRCGLAGWCGVRMQTEAVVWLGWCGKKQVTSSYSFFIYNSFIKVNFTLRSFRRIQISPIFRYFNSPL